MANMIYSGAVLFYQLLPRFIFSDYSATKPLKIRIKAETESIFLDLVTIATDCISKGCLAL